MSTRLDTALQTLHDRRKGLSADEQDAIAKMLESILSDDLVDLEDHLTPDQIAELDRRLARPVDPVDPAEVNAFFEKHGIPSNF